MTDKVAPRSPTLDDPTAGRSSEQWLRSFASRSDRLKRLVELGAPPNIISSEVALIVQAAIAIEALHGDRATSRVFVAPAEGLQ